MAKYAVGDEVEILVNGWPVDRGVVREVVDDLETGITIVVVDWQRVGRLRQIAGELRKRSTAKQTD